MCFIIWIIFSIAAVGVIGSLLDYYGHKKRDK